MSMQITFEKYGKFLNDKRVIIVGPAAYMLGHKQGEFIDTFDVVVRINMGSFMTRSNPEDFGTRGDILYNCMNGSQPGASGPLDFKLWEKMGLKILIYKPNALAVEFIRRNKTIYHMNDPKFLNSTWKKFGNPHMGFYAMKDVVVLIPVC